MTMTLRRGGWKAALRSKTAWLTLAALAMSATAQAQITCRASAEARNLRHYGAAELLADLRLDCTGGRAPAPGETVPVYQIVVSADAPLTMRSFAEDEIGAVQWTEALLLVDDPAPRDQRPCVPSVETIEEQPGAIDCGENEGRANVFQGLRLQQNAVVFQQTPIEPPGANRTRTLRIVNLRADVRALTPDPEAIGESPAEVYLTVRIFGPGGETVVVEQADQLVGRLIPDAALQVRTASNNPVPETEPAVLTAPGLTPQGRPEAGPTFLLQFSELAPDVFRRRNVGSNGVNPTFLTSQASPGAAPHTESGFFNAAFPNRRGLNQAGLADSGTRLRVVMDDVPPGIRVWFSYREVETGTTAYDPEVPRARLTAPEGGAFRPQLPESGEFIEVWPSNGHAEVLWEITSSDPDAIETLSFAVGMTGPNGDVDLGDASILGYLAEEYAAPDEDDETAGAAIPSFDVSAKALEPRPAFSVVPSLPMSELVGASAASYSAGAVAPGSIVAGFGEDLAAATMAATGAPGPRLGRTRVEVIDSSGALRAASIFAVSPGQVNFLLDPDVRLGPAVVTVYDENRPLAEGRLEIANVAPGLFGANGDGMGAPAGQWLIDRSGARGGSPLAEWDPATGRNVPAAIDIEEGAGTYLVLYGTGIRRAAAADVELTVGRVSIPVAHAGDQGQYAGLDQINAGPLPTSLAGRGLADVRIRIGQATSNTLQVLIR